MERKCIFVAMTCKRPPDEATIGYVIGEDKDLTLSNFSAGSVECAENYHGSAYAIKCASNGSSYSVSGCTGTKK